MRRSDRGRGTSRQELQRLAPGLDRISSPDPPPGLVEETLRAARLELARPVPEPPRLRVPAVLPVGFKRELARILCISAAPLSVVLLWNALVVLALPPLLSDWMPALLARALVGAYAIGALGWLALVYGSLPLVAHRKALLRHREALP